MNRYLKIAKNIKAAFIDQRIASNFSTGDMIVWLDKGRALSDVVESPETRGYWVIVRSVEDMHRHRDLIGKKVWVMRNDAQPMVASKVEMIASRIVEAIKFDTKKEIQKYKQEHDITPGTKLQVRNEHEKEQRNKEKAK